VVAAFDFDKTVSTRDNLVPFLRRVGGLAAVLRAMVAAAPLLVAQRRNAAKRRVLRSVFRGLRAEEVRSIGDEYAHRVVERYLRDDVVRRMRWHRDQGHGVVLVSASLDCYLERVGTLLDVDAVLCTRLEVTADGRLTGRMVGANVRGTEKVRRLDAWLDGADAVVYAYGDSAGDRALLARADHPVRVGRRRVSTPES
jgi:phosphatidylglycerophosphatase C